MTTFKVILYSWAYLTYFNFILCQDNSDLSTYRSQIRFLDDSNPEPHSEESEEVSKLPEIQEFHEPVKIQTKSAKFHEPVVLPRVINLPLFRYDFDILSSILAHFSCFTGFRFSQF